MVSVVVCVVLNLPNLVRTTIKQWFTIKLESEFDVKLYVQFVCEFGVYICVVWWVGGMMINKTYTKNGKTNTFLYTEIS